MANLFIAYDLYQPGQNYDAVEKAVKALGTACKLLNTTWHVKSSKSFKEARDAVAAVMDKNDKLLVIDANSAATSGTFPECWQSVVANWNR